MELLWIVLSLLALDLAALLFAADTRPGLEHSARSRTLRPCRLPSGTRRPQATRRSGVPHLGTRRSFGA